MAAVSVLTLRNGIIPLVSSFDVSSLQTTKVEHKWTTGNAPNTTDHYSKLYLPVVNDPSDKELFLYVIDQFMDASHNDRLHLSTGTSLYTKFRQVLGGDLRIRWQTLSDAQANKTTGTFATDLTAFIAKYLPPSAFEDQEAYYLTCLYGPSRSYGYFQEGT